MRITSISKIKSEVPAESIENDWADDFIDRAPIQDGGPPEKLKFSKTRPRFPLKLMKRVEDLAWKRRTSMNALLIELVELGLGVISSKGVDSSGVKGAKGAKGADSSGAEGAKL